ncbi:hypothetical protein DB346_06310 [Verrucomicrobia bacterium LW23]|nr:hypothetical protein DB346_06310 [Verrucomicrobia bacterium LW23]
MLDLHTFCTHISCVPPKSAATAARPGSGPIVIKEGSSSVKIHTINRGTRVVYSVDYSLAGKRVLKQFSDLAKAKVYAREAARKLAGGHQLALQLSNADSAIYGLAMKALEGTGRRLDSACEEYAAALRELKGTGSLIEAARHYYQSRGNLVPMLVPTLVENLKARNAGKSEKYKLELRLRLRKFADAFGGYVHTITAKEIAMWLDNLIGASRTRNNFRSLIITLFKYAQKEGHLPPGITEAEKVDERDTTQDEGDIEIFKPDEFRRLVEAARSYKAKGNILAYLLIGGFAGVRTEEIKRLHWSEINLNTGYIEIKKSKAKTKSRRLIKMQPNLVAWLKTIRKAGESGPVVDMVRPEKAAAEQICALTKNKELNSAPVTWKRNALRHSFCTYRYAICKNEHEVSAEMGNSPQMIFQNYRQLATEEDAKDWFNIYPSADTDGKEQG